MGNRCRQDLGSKAGPGPRLSSAAASAAGGAGAPRAAAPPAVAYTNDLYRVTDGDDAAAVNYGPAAHPPAEGGGGADSGERPRSALAAQTARNVLLRQSTHSDAWS